MLRILIPLCSFFVIAQQPVFDGVVSAKEWQDAQQFSIPYEIEPSDNGPAHYNTEVFVHQVGNDLFVGFIAYANMNELRSSIRSRDQIDGDDNVAIGIDTYGDGRNMIVLGSNPDGSQFDLKILPNGDNDEYNEFDDTLFIQPLLKWNPNPFTVLFVGGSQGYGEGEITGNLDIDSSQLYFKFQYLFEI